MKSAALKLGDSIDCRQIIFSGSFYSLSNTEANSLVNDYCSFVRDRFSENCIIEWNTSPRKISLHKQMALCNLQDRFENYSISLYAYVKSDIIFNKKTRKAFDYKKEFPSIPRSVPGGYASIDYPEYYISKIQPFVSDPLEYKRALLQLFDIENKIHLGEYYARDINGFCIKQKIQENENLFVGQFSLSVSVYCLNGGENSWAQELVQFGRQLSEEYENVNIQIEINPYAESYGRYYGTYIKRGPMDKRDSLLWKCASHLFINGIGWAHIASAKTLALESVCIDNKNNEKVYEEDLPNGAKLFRSNSQISKTSVSDLKEMKKRLYDLVMPRKELSIMQNRPRCFWEMIPVFDNELTIVDGKFLLEHKGSINQQKIFDLMDLKPF